MRFRVYGVLGFRALRLRLRLGLGPTYADPRRQTSRPRSDPGPPRRPSLGRAQSRRDLYASPRPRARSNSENRQGAWCGGKGVVFCSCSVVFLWFSVVFCSFSVVFLSLFCRFSVVFLSFFCWVSDVALFVSPALRIASALGIPSAPGIPC